MANVTVPYPEVGLAAFEQLDTYLQKFLLTGSHPALAPGFPMKIAANQTLQQFHVVGLNAAGAIVPAVYSATPASLIKPVGIVTQAVVGNASGTTTVPVWYSGCFNPDALIWDASWTTDELKAAAFIGSPTPTTILIRKRG